MVAQETNASLPGCLCRPPTAFLSSSALIRDGSGFGAMSSLPRASRTTPTGGVGKKSVTAVRTLVVYAEGVRSFSVIEKALRAHYANRFSANCYERERCASDVGGLVLPDLINAFATSRTKPNMNPPTTVPYITEART